MGYDVGRVPLTVTKDTILDTLFLMPTAKTIDQLVVVAERPPLIMKNDTMEFNASAFKTLPDALVEDLLGKLPGVERDENGDLMVNGKKVTKLTVDGKVFFGSDPAIALKNLPANSIDKIQITTDDEYQNENNPTGTDDETVVINLTIKKGMKKGYFGKVYAGGGVSPPDRYLFESGGIVNVFRDTFQISVIGFGNNTNKQAFNFQELTSIGGFDRSGVSSWYSSNSGTRIGNVSLGGATEGFNLATGGGINVNHNLERSYLNFQYFYGGNEAEVKKESYVVQSFSDSVLNRSTFSDNQSNTRSHRMSMAWEFDKDTLTEIRLRVGATVYENDDFGDSETETYSGNLFLNSSDRENEDKYKNIELTQSGTLHRLSRNQKWNSYITYDLGRTYQTRNSQSLATFGFFEGVLRDSFQNQLRLMDKQADQAELYASTAYNITDSLVLRLTYNGDYFNTDNRNETFNREVSSNFIDSTLSNQIISNSIRNDLSLSLTFIFPGMSITPGVTMVKYDQMNTYNFGEGESEIHDIKMFPSLYMRIGELRISYNIEYSPPDMYDLNPVLDNSGISSQTAGNPELNSEVMHSLDIYTNKYNPKNQLYYYIYANANSYITAIEDQQQILENGVYFRSPVNVAGKQSFYGGGTIRKTWKYENKNSLVLGFSTWSDLDRTPIYINDELYTFTSLNVRPLITVDVNFKDRVEMSQIFSYRYRSNQRTETELTIGNTYTSSTAIIIRYPVRFMWRMSFDLNYTEFNDEDIPLNEYYLFNAEVFYNVDAKGKWQLNLKAYDILNQNQRITTYSSDNYVYFSKGNVLQRYLLLTLVYNINTFKGTEVNSRDRSFWWW